VNEPTLPLKACASVGRIVVGIGVRVAGARRVSKNSSRGQPEGRRGNRRRFERPEERDRSVTSCRHQVRNMLHPPLRRIKKARAIRASLTARTQNSALSARTASGSSVPAEQASSLKHQEVCSGWVSGANRSALRWLSLGVLGPVKALQTQPMTFRNGKCKHGTRERQPLS